MEHLFNLRTVCVGNYIGLVLLLILFFENAWRLRRRNGEDVSIMLMILTCMSSCFLDPIAYYFDGIPGYTARIMSFVVNDILFVSYSIISTCWVYFMSVHLEGKITRVHFTVLLSIIASIFIMVGINHFYPIAFAIDDKGNYIRGFGYYINLLADAIIVSDGLFLYARCRRKGGFMKSFPVAGYITPIAIATVIQSNFYGISVISPSIAVGIASILAGLKNEHAYRDEQTGLFNRSYLDTTFAKIVTKNRVTGFLIHLNNLDSINEAHGFEEGDRAVIASASFLNEAVGEMGSVARFSTDKFVVLLNTQAATIIKVLEDEIRNNFERFNRDNNFSLSISMCNVKLNKDNSELFLMLNELNRQLNKS